MLYDDLDAGQKEILAAWERNFRGWINQIISTGIVSARALDAHYDAADGPGDILALLDPGQVVPDSSAIAGAQDLDTADFTVLIAGFKSFLSTYDTDVVRRLAAKAAGPLAGT